MSIFKLPDLGEGLTEAEIHEWHVSEGDEVKTDQLMVSMETAKAVVDVPAPCNGKIIKLYGKQGDIINTGAPLVEFEGDIVTDARDDAGSVVGNISHEVTSLDAETPLATDNAAQGRILPGARALARRFQIDIDQLSGTGRHGIITKADVLAAKDKQTHAPEGYEPLRGIRRTMAKAMIASHQEIVPVTIYDDADIAAWPDGTDITSRIIRAVVKACLAEPALNAWFDTNSLSRHIHDTVNLGIAMDSKDGLFVPVIHNADKMQSSDIRKTIERFKKEVGDRSIASTELQGATITLSNFGTFAGRYANPIIVPPAVAILGTGRLRTEPVSVGEGSENHRILPLSLTFDHRAVTGGEATRFLGTVIEELKQTS